MELAASSPVAASSDAGDGSRARKPPSVTPRTFRRFFTPRSSLTRSGGVSSARRALRDITTPASNRGGSDAAARHSAGLTPFPDIFADGDESAGPRVPSMGRRRKALASPETSPDLSGRAKRRRTHHPTLILEDAPRDEPPSSPLGTLLEHEEASKALAAAHPVRKETVARFKRSSVAARILQRSMGEECGGLVRAHCAGWSSGRGGSTYC